MALLYFLQSSKQRDLRKFRKQLQDQSPQTCKRGKKKNEDFPCRSKRRR